MMLHMCFMNVVSISPDRLDCGAGRLIALPRAHLAQTQSVSQ